MLAAVTPALAQPAGISADSPLVPLLNFFNDGVAIFTKFIVPGACVCIAGWIGLKMAMGKTSFFDSVPAFMGLALAASASIVIGWFTSIGA